MRLATEYLQEAIRFERMAAEAADLSFKRQCLEQADAYRKLAKRRASKLTQPSQPPAQTKSPTK
jgi:hypothetical protein